MAHRRTSLAFCGDRRRGGFTLVELLVVMSIIAILVAILVPTIIVVRRTAKSTSTKNLLYQINSALQNYSTDWGSAPPDFCPSDAEFVKFVDYTAADRYISPPPTLVASAEALYYHLANTNLTGTPYLELQREVQRTDYNSNRLPEVVDSWGRPFLYNRPSAGQASGFDAAGDPIHNLPGSAVPFDLFSVGGDGVTSNGNDPLPHYRTALEQFNDKALEGSYGYGDDDIYNW